MHPTPASHDFAEFVGEKVAAHADDVWTIGKVQCLHQHITPSMTRNLPVDTLLSNKSQTFSIVWADNTDSICDLPSMLTFLDNFKGKRHRTNATSSSPVTDRSARRASNGVGAPSSLPSPSSLPQSLLLPPHTDDPPPTAPSSAAGIFGGIPTRPGDLVDSLTRSGSFAFLSHVKRRTNDYRFPLALWEVWFCSQLGVSIPELIGTLRQCPGEVVMLFRSTISETTCRRVKTSLRRRRSMTGWCADLVTFSGPCPSG